MRRLLRVAGWIGLGFVTLVALAIGSTFVFYPRFDPPAELEIERTDERVERGRYLVEHVANCLDCHSDRDWSFYGGPVVPGTEGQGGYLRVLRPETQSANITPAALGEWTDGEIVRAITAGVSRDGRPLHPFMPYDTYARMTEADVYAVVAYLRTLPPIDHVVEPSLPEEIFPIRVLARILPRPWTPPEPVDPSDRVAYGQYLAGIAECGFCHGSDYAGGNLFRIPGTDQEWPSENITPHPSNRIGAWSRENFIGVFKSFAPPDGARIPGHEINSVMPWSRFAGITDEDLGAIYDYLRTVEPIAKEPAEQAP